MLRVWGGGVYLIEVNLFKHHINEISLANNFASYQCLHDLLSKV